jgi:hypothetical protein
LTPPVDAAHHPHTERLAAVSFSTASLSTTVLKTSGGVAFGLATHQPSGQSPAEGRVTEIRHQQQSPSPNVSLSEIHIPDDSDLGTGTFSTVFNPGALSSNTAFDSIIVNEPRFQISATVNLNKEVPVRLGRADGSQPLDRVVFRLPNGLDLREAKALRIEFARWRITGAFLDDVPLSRADASRSSSQ